MEEKWEHFIWGGRFTSREKWIHPARCIDSFELIAVTEGRVYMEEDGERYTLCAGDTLLLEPSKQHGGFAHSESRVSFYWIHFDDFSFSKHKGIRKAQRLSNPYALTLLCRQLLFYSEGGHPDSVKNALLHVLLAELDSQGRREENADSALVRRVEEWIRINSDRTLSAKEVADRFGYHADYLSRLFRRCCGHGLKAEIDAKRLGEIKRMLMETELSLAEVADRVGMQDYKLFLKFFKYHEGITPTEFRGLYAAMHTNNR